MGYSNQELAIMLVEARTQNQQWMMQVDRLVTERNKLLEIVTKGTVQFPQSKEGRPVISGERPSQQMPRQELPKQAAPVTPPPPPPQKPVVTPAPPRQASKPEW